MVKRILLVDDDDTLRETLTEQLKAHDEFDVVAFNGAGVGLRYAQKNRVDLALLDVFLPDMDGRELCRDLRKNGLSAPILMLTSASGNDDAVRGLDAGADDYVAKPFHFNVLLARIRANLRKHEKSEEAELSIGSCLLRPSVKLLIRDGDDNIKIRVTEKETAILKYLYRAGGRTVSRSELLQEIWGYNREVHTHTLETHIYRLRRKIAIVAEEKDVLLTSGDGGYRLVI